MDTDTQNAVDHIRDKIQTIDPYADIYVLPLAGFGYHQETEIYILTPKEVDYAIEQQYINARYEAEVLAEQSFKMYLFNKSDWHQNHIETPIYEKVHNEGIML